MNQANNTQPHSMGSDTTFPSQPATNTNPFATDLKGEFTSNFGTNANSVSQIFKDGGFGSENRTKYLMVAGAIVLLVVVAFVVYPKLSATEDDFAPAEGDAATATAEGDAAKAEGEAAAPVEGDAATAAAPAEGEAAPAATDAAAPAADAAAAPATAGPVDTSIALSSPENGASGSYDETQPAMQFSWSAQGGSTIVFSRSQDFSNVFRRVTANGSYAFHPYPGTWYWRVDANGGSSEVRSFNVSAPTRRNISVAEPTTGGSVAGTGGVVKWNKDEGVSYYRVEMVQSGTKDWSSPAYRFATQGGEAQLNNVAPGSYEMRVGALSKVSGRWEYTSPQAVSVQ